MIRIDCPAYELLPHREGMLLLDHAIEGDESCISAEAIIHKEGLFVHDGKIGSWTLLEYMAQTMGLWACWQAKLKGLPQPVGFLLGTRKLSIKVPFIDVGTKLTFRAELIYLSDDGVAQFSCQTFLEDEEIASAKINAFQPSNLDHFLKNMTFNG